MDNCGLYPFADGQLWYVPRSAVSRLSSCVSAQGFRNPPPSLASVAFNDDAGGEHDDFTFVVGDGTADVDPPAPHGTVNHPSSGRTTAFGRRIDTILEADKSPADGVGDADVDPACGVNNAASDICSQRKNIHS